MVDMTNFTDNEYARPWERPDKKYIKEGSPLGKKGNRCSPWLKHLGRLKNYCFDQYLAHFLIAVVQIVNASVLRP